MRRQKGLVLVLALLVLISVTILGVSAVSSSLLQSKMAVSMQQNGLAFDAAEAALSGVMFEAEDELLLASNNLDPLTEARQGNEYDPTIQDMSCHDDEAWTTRHLTSNGLDKNTQHLAAGKYHTIPATESWSRTAFVREQACRGSSNVVGGNSINCHVFVIRGCGRVSGRSSITANTMTASVFAPASQ
ncbi:pilus assembly protein PilZ [Alteromonas sediminis]|uniref:Pilus assembly protein PilZ n=1 Tax=Alteromonas sediminis TaxID=2259342 RepID=A0A3N5XXR2_9ALTE|nr:PilX N-terminal domain-containing pilus assembly protein [Alteromonas sediminis]RPJ65622.1 pilus assembly protein PilZ [Alteromonas sediminis]